MTITLYLTKTEQKLIVFLEKGFSNKSIAEEIDVSEVKYHLKSIFKKLNIKRLLEDII